MVEAFDQEILDGLKKAGFKVTSGPDSSGQLLMVFDRGGGYCAYSSSSQMIEYKYLISIVCSYVGCAALIHEGKVKVKQGCEIARVSQTGVL